jgi:hypothetical protein
MSITVQKPIQRLMFTEIASGDRLNDQSPKKYRITHPRAIKEMATLIVSLWFSRHSSVLFSFMGTSKGV